MQILHAGLSWFYWGRLEPDCLDRPGRAQIAGGETAMLRAAFETAARGHDVHVVTWSYPGRHRGVRFHDKHDFYDVVIDGGPWDAVVVWGEPTVLAELTHAGALDGALRICAMQCNGFAHRDALRGYVDVYVSPSQHHADMLRDVFEIPAEKFWVIPNAVHPARYRFDKPRDPFAVYHASSPDRGLHHLLEAWPEIRITEPRATLDVYYEVEKFLKYPFNHPLMDDLVLRIKAAIAGVRRGRGVTFRGAQPQQVVADRATTAGVMAYPCDPVVYTEGYGTAVLEAYCAGAEVVCSDADAFGEVYGAGGIGLDLMPKKKIREELVPRVLAALERAREQRPNSECEPALRARLEAYSWAQVGKRWCALLEKARAPKMAEAAA